MSLQAATLICHLGVAPCSKSLNLSGTPAPWAACVERGGAQCSEMSSWLRCQPHTGLLNIHIKILFATTSERIATQQLMHSPPPQKKT